MQSEPLLLLGNNRTTSSLRFPNGNIVEDFSLAAVMETSQQHLHWLSTVKISGWFPHWLFSFNFCHFRLSISLRTNHIMSLLCLVNSQNFPIQRPRVSPGQGRKGLTWLTHELFLSPACFPLTYLAPELCASLSISPISCPQCLLVLSSLPGPSSLDRAPWLLSFSFKCLLECSLTWSHVIPPTLLNLS